MCVKREGRKAGGRTPTVCGGSGRSRKAHALPAMPSHTASSTHCMATWAGDSHAHTCSLFLSSCSFEDSKSRRRRRRKGEEKKRKENFLPLFGSAGRRGGSGEAGGGGGKAPSPVFEKDRHGSGRLLLHTGRWEEEETENELSHLLLSPLKGRRHLNRWNIVVE